VDRGSAPTSSVCARALTTASAACCLALLQAAPHTLSRMAASSQPRNSWRAVPAAISAVALMAMIAWKAGGAPVELASGRDDLRRQQQQTLELREMERDWGARIQVLAGVRSAHGAARLQALDARPPKGPGASFRAMRAAGEGRLQALVEKGAPPGNEWDARIGKVEKKYKELAAERRADTFFEELKVKQIFAKEIEKLKTQGQEEEERLRRDEENAETTILAKKKEYEIKRQLQAVQDAAHAKAKHLEAELAAAHRLALKYQKAVSADKLPDGLHVDLPKRLFPGVDSGVNTKSGSVLDQMTAAAEVEERKATAAAKEAHQAEREREKQAAAHAKAKADAAEKAAEAAKKAAERKERQAKEAKEEAEHKAKEEAQRKKLDEERAKRARALAAAAKASAAKLEADRKKEEARALRCTDDNCPLSTMDKVTVVDGDSIHKLEDRAENGRGKDKVQALAMISQLQSKIQNDFKAVTGFALHQEHILDVKKVSKETASELGQEVELSLMREHGRLPASSLRFAVLCPLWPRCLRISLSKKQN
jgi:membrane protein involved in colicin uptake